MPYARPGKPGTTPASGARRALRLVIAAGFAAAGLCLVVGLTTLVVKIGAGIGPGQAATMPDALGALSKQDGLHVTASSSPPHAVTRVRVLRVYRGTGRGSRGPFRVGTPGAWGLSWAFSCGTGNGQFALAGRSTVNGKEMTVAASGPAGRGVTWARSTAGKHVLTVDSGCTWAIKVLLAARPGY